MSSVAPDTDNDISGTTDVTQQSASVAPSSDAIAASPGDSDSATATPNTIRISIDGVGTLVNTVAS